MRKIKPIFQCFCIISLFCLSSCANYDEDFEQETSLDSPAALVSKVIDASKDEVLKTNDGIKLIIPQGAIDENVEVTLGRDKEALYDSSREDYESIASAVSLNIPTLELKKEVFVEIPKPKDFDKSNTIITAFDGISYFPLSYKDMGDFLLISVDEINWNNAPDVETRGLWSGIKGIVINFFKAKQTPSPEMFGLKEVRFLLGNMTFYDVESIDEEGNYLVLIHGLASSPETWFNFIPEFVAKSKVKYKILTYGYQTSKHIDTNALEFASIIKNHFGNTNARLALVGHSMGGLVSRSAIENHGLERYVSNLITLGTPHLGSPMASFRYLLSDIISVVEGKQGLTEYNEVTRGIQDLDPSSDYIARLQANPPSSVPYYAIAAINQPYNFLFGLGWPPSIEQDWGDGRIFEMLEGDDDGVVTTKSALAIQEGLNNKFSIIHIDSYMAHTKFKRNVSLVHALAAYLNDSY